MWLRKRQEVQVLLQDIMGFLSLPDNEANSIAAESRAHASLAHYEAEREVEKLETELEKAEKDNDEDTFKGGSAIAKVHEKLKAAEAVREAAQTKLNWERRDEWKRRIPTDKKTTKQLMQNIDWKNIRKP